MQKWNGYLCCCILAVALLGCEEQKKTQEPNLEGLTLGDLRPLDAPQQKEATHLSFITYQIPAAGFDALQDSLEHLGRDHIRLADATAFQANTFAIGMGDREGWPLLASVMDQMGAQKLGTKHLISFENQADDLSVLSIREPHTVFYTGFRGQVKGLDINNGTFVWRVYSHPGLNQVQIRIAPAFQPTTAPTLEGIVKEEETRDIAFRSIAFAATLKPGQFVMLWPSTLETTGVSLADIYFRGSAHTSPYVYLYLITCVGLSG